MNIEDGLIDDALTLLKRNSHVDQADVLLTQEHGFSASVRNRDVEQLEYHQERGFSVTVYHNKRSGSASTTAFTKAAIQDTIEKAVSIARFTDQDPFSGLADPERMAHHYPDCDLHHPWNISPEQAIDIAMETEAAALDENKLIVPAEESYVSTYESQRIYGNTHGFIGQYQKTLHTIGCGVVVNDQQEMQRDFEYTTARHHEQLEPHTWVGRHAAQKTVQRLQAQKIKTQQCPVMFHAPLARGLLGSFIGAISGGSLYRKSSFLLDHLDKIIFPEWVDIYQQPHLLRALGSRPFDAEGVATDNRHYVSQGRLTSYALGSYSARKLGLSSTGNASGVSNLTTTHSNKNFQELLQLMGTGLLVTELIGQGVRLMTGDYSRGAFGFWVENGKIQHPVSEITIAGNLKDMFQQIVAIGNDTDQRGQIHSGSILIEQMTIAGQ